MIKPYRFQIRINVNLLGPLAIEGEESLIVHPYYPRGGCNTPSTWSIGIDLPMLYNGRYMCHGMWNISGYAKRELDA